MLGLGSLRTGGALGLVGPFALAVVQRVAVDHHDGQHQQRKRCAAQAGGAP